MPRSAQKRTNSWTALYEIVKRIPKGRVITYGQLARAAKLRGGAREAGHALAACPQGQGIPWHRVVGAGGRLLVREPYASLQRQLLGAEGALAGNRADLKRHGWEPPKRPRRSSISAKPKSH